MINHFVTILLIGAAPCFGDVRLPKILNSHMVLQQNSEVKIWGWADPGEGVLVQGDWLKEPIRIKANLDDKALLHRALNGNWEWIDKDLTLVTIPGVGHFVQQDAADLVTRTMKMWLAREQGGCPQATCGLRVRIEHHRAAF